MATTYNDNYDPMGSQPVSLSTPGRDGRMLVYADISDSVNLTPAYAKAFYIANGSASNVTVACTPVGAAIATGVEVLLVTQ